VVRVQDQGDVERAGRLRSGVPYRAGKKGKQFVVICAGGYGKMRTKIGDYVMALALP
jgi:glucose dehydrogenase